MLSASYLDEESNCILVEACDTAGLPPYFTVKIGPYVTLFFDPPRLALLRQQIDAALVDYVPVEPPPPEQRSDGTVEHLPADADAISPEPPEVWF